MFGPYVSGSLNKDLSLFKLYFTNTNIKKFKSLNLSHSVTIICYEIFKILNSKYFKKKRKKK